MKNVLKNQKKPSKMRFEIVEEGGQFSIYFMSDTDRMFLGRGETREDAEMAIRKVAKTWGAEAVRGGLSNDTQRRLNALTKRRLQVSAITLDPPRATSFYENLTMFNYSLHMMTDSYDEVDYVFSAAIDKSTRDHFKIAQKHIEGLLASVYNSRIQGDADDYVAVNKKAMYIKERIMLLIAYVMSSDDLESHRWRLNELDKCLDNILPDSYIEEQRKRIADRIISSLTGKSENNNQ